LDSFLLVADLRAQVLQREKAIGNNLQLSAAAAAVVHFYPCRTGFRLNDDVHIHINKRNPSAVLQNVQVYFMRFGPERGLYRLRILFTVFG
jgi:hypothetical protein